MYVIVLTKANLVQDGLNSNFIYRFPNSVPFPNHEIAIQSVNMYYSWNNIASNLANQSFNYVWYDIISPETTPSAKTKNITIPAGIYEVSNLNSFLQSQFIINGEYLINATGQNVYFAEFVLNPTLYSVQINTYPVPTSSGWTYSSGTGIWTGNTGTIYAGWTTPVANSVIGANSGWTNWTTGNAGVKFNPSITILDNLSNLLGFPNATFNNGTQVGNLTTPLRLSGDPNYGVNYSITSSAFSLSPNLSPNNCVFVSMSNIANNYAVPNSVIYAISPSVAIGQQIIEKPPQFAWNKLLSGTYNQLRVSLLGTGFIPLQILDPNITITLVLRDTKDLGLNDLMTRISGQK